tara:strand:- start:6396 stop:9791 length:3396 start_codon:yes stop_codon:yes gene_type:complete
MSVDKFKFVSPGIFIDEIDESGIPALPERMGPLVIGRFEKGPAHRPVRVNSFREFVSIFGNPSDGSPATEVWRHGALTAPTYAAYAVQAWLRNNSPCTVYRVLGQNPSDASSTAPGLAGWITDNTPNTALKSAGGAYGLFVMPDPDAYGSTAASTLAGTIQFSGYGASDDFTVLVPSNAGGSGTAMTVRLTGADATGASSTTSTVIAVGVSSTPSAGTVAETVVDAINGNFGTGNGQYKHNFAAANSGVNTGIAGVTASLLSSTQVKLTATTTGPVGNDIQVTMGTGAPGASNVLYGGAHYPVTGTLAAVWYVQNGGVVLTGTARDGAARQGAGVLIKSSGTATSGPQFTAKVIGATENELKTTTFNFNRDSKLFARRVFNTDPTKTNSEVVYTGGGTTVEKYWLGETYESALFDSENPKLKVTGSSPQKTNMLGVILQLNSPSAGTYSDSNLNWHDRRQNARAAATGWFISQDTRGDTYAGFDPTQHTERLFKLHALGGAGATQDPGCGASSNRDVKVSIEAIKAPTDNFNDYGNFSIVVRKASDNDNRPEILERFSNVNLNPKSANFIKRLIGDRNYGYNTTNKTITDLGEYENRSKYIRVETSPVVDSGEARGLHPFGVYGPSVPKTWSLASGSQTDSPYALGSGSLPTALLTGSGQSLQDWVAGTMVYTQDHITASFEFPTARLRVSSSEGSLVLPTKAYFGYQPSIKDTKRFDETNLDLLRSSPAGHDPHAIVSAESQWSWVFTLDDVSESLSDADHSLWISGSRANQQSWTSKSGSVSGILDKGFNKFTSPMFGGFDGFDITEQDPLANRVLSGGSEKSNYAFYSIKKALDIASDKEFIEYDVSAIPGVTNSTLNVAMVENCEERGDAMAVIDLEGNYEPPHEHALLPTDAAKAGSVSSVVTNLQGLNINSSYGCTFYPFVRIRDTINDSVLYVPPSVVALGTFSSSQRKSAVWFAPAGFTRGGLSEGSAGLPVIGVRERITSADRDTLYDANINPIASFPAEGIVIFGQKTLQVTQSALDRINVRRLLIFLKKEISRIASRVLFDQNVQQTWDRFTGQVVPFLEGVQAGLGLTDFKVVLDEDTTTPDLVDRNIMYAKIFLKPARAIEFIALDFIITRSGASFDD